jgi:hypothetical protein
MRLEMQKKLKKSQIESCKKLKKDGGQFIKKI